MIDVQFRVEISLPRRAVLLAFALFLLAGSPLDLQSETISLTAPYPAPSALYPKLLSANSAWLSSTGSRTTMGTGAFGGAGKLYVGNYNGSAGNTSIGPAGAALGWVGVNGITTPSYALDVQANGGGVGIQIVGASGNLQLMASGNGIINETGAGGNIQLPVGSDRVYINANGVGGPGLSQVPDPHKGYEFYGTVYCAGSCPQ
jgi:hypothetical protein